MKGFKKFLYVMNTHISEPTASLIRTVSLAKNNQAELTLLLVIPKLILPTSAISQGLDSSDIEKEAFTREEENIRHLIEKLDSEVKIKAIVRTGKRYLESIREVITNDFDVLMKEVEEVSWLERLIGSDDMHLLRNCPCPVWLMSKQEKPQYKQILAAVDFDSEDDETCNEELNGQIIDLASSIALTEFSTLHMVNTYDASDSGFISLWVQDPEKVEKEILASAFRNSRYKMDLLCDQLKQEIGNESYNYLCLRPHLIKGSAGEQLPKVAKSLEADLVVMGTLARTGITGLVIGNTAETILNQLNCSVLGIKPKGFVSPIS